MIANSIDLACELWSRVKRGGSLGLELGGALLILFLFLNSAAAQEVSNKTENVSDAPRKVNSRPPDARVNPPEPFDGASVEKMAVQCVTLETVAGSIEITLIPEAAPESVRNFLNLAGTGALDTTTFSRTVKDFVIQGGNLSTSEKWGAALAQRMARKIPDEPNYLQHERGVVSMAPPEEPNSASTHFFILVGDGHHLDGKFAAFGRVTKGLEVADAINHAPAQGEKPEKPVKLTRAIVTLCHK